MKFIHIFILSVTLTLVPAPSASPMYYFNQLIGFISSFVSAVAVQDTNQEQNVVEIRSNKRKLENDEPQTVTKKQKLDHLISKLTEIGFSPSLIQKLPTSIIEAEKAVNWCLDNVDKYRQPHNHLTQTVFVNQGLRNSNGTDCFLSASMQILSQIDPFITTLTAIAPQNRTSLQKEFLEFIDCLRGKNGKYDPADDATKKFRNFVTSFIPEMGGTTQKDAQEFFSKLLDQLIESKEAQHKETLTNPFKLLQKTKARFALLGNEWTDLNSAELSLILPLSINGHRTLYDCLNNYSSEEYIANLAYGGFELGGHKKTMFVSPLPPIISVHFERVQVDFQKRIARKIITPISFPLLLTPEDIAPCVDGKDYSHYELFGIIVHTGSASFDNTVGLKTSGHYRAYTKDRFTDQWRYYNDSMACDVSKEDIAHLAQQNQVTGALSPDGYNELGSPYMLFYKRIE